MRLAHAGRRGIDLSVFARTSLAGPIADQIFFNIPLDPRSGDYEDALRAAEHSLHPVPAKSMTSSRKHKKDGS
jgi:hypothetical protein